MWGLAEARGVAEAGVLGWAEAGSIGGRGAAEAEGSGAAEAEVRLPKDAMLFGLRIRPRGLPPTMEPNWGTAHTPP